MSKSSEENKVAVSSKIDDVSIEETTTKLDLLYSIHDTPPWYLSCVLGFQVSKRNFSVLILLVFICQTWHYCMGSTSFGACAWKPDIRPRVAALPDGVWRHHQYSVHSSSGDVRDRPARHRRGHQHQLLRFRHDHVLSGTDRNQVSCATFF